LTLKTRAISIDRLTGPAGVSYDSLENSQQRTSSSSSHCPLGRTEEATLYAKHNEDGRMGICL